MTATDRAYERGVLDGKADTEAALKQSRIEAADAEAMRDPAIRRAMLLWDALVRREASPGNHWSDYLEMLRIVFVVGDAPHANVTVDTVIVDGVER